MFQSIANFFSSSDFMPHGHCFLWQPSVLWLHVVSDASVAAAYFAIPFVLIYFIYRRKDMPFPAVFWLFGAFILLCGTTHLMSIWVIWHPDYALEGIIKAMTGIVSIATFFFIVKLIPQALAIPGVGKLTEVNNKLKNVNLEVFELMASIVNASDDAILSETPDGIITSWNPAACRLFGYSKEEMTGKSIMILVPPEKHEEERKIQAQLREGKSVEHLETVRGTKNGQLINVLLTLSPLRDSSGNIMGFSKIIRDITELKQVEAQRKRDMQDLERSNQELDDFAYIASHDLKEPLRGLYNHAAFLIEDFADKLGSDGARRLHRLATLAQRMERLVADLLYFSRLGRTELAIQDSDPGDMIQEIRQMLEPVLKERNATIEVPKPLPRIVCDRPRVTEAFRNLITNSVKYNDKPECHVEVGFLESVERPQKETEHHVFYVRDNGIGIEAEFHEEVIRIFKRLQRDSNEKEPGTGAGLTFVKKIIDRHGGTIWIESQPGKNTTFYFTLGRRAS
jgi:two-component system sensor kinase FixL